MYLLRLLTCLCVLNLLLGQLHAQMQPHARFKGEWCPIVSCEDEFVFVQKGSWKKGTEYGDVDVRSADSFGTGLVNIQNISANYDPLKNASSKERSKPDAIKFRYEADVSSAEGLDDCYALLVFLANGSVGTHLTPLGSLKPGKARHVKLEFKSSVDEVGFLHVFSKAKEIKSNQVTKAYDVRAYFTSLASQMKGVSAFDLCKTEETFPMLLSDDGSLLATSRDMESQYNVIVYDLNSMKLLCSVPAGKAEEKVKDLHWVNNNLLVFMCGQQLKLLNVEKKELTMLDNHGGRIICTPKNHPELLVLSGWSKGLYFEKYNVLTNKIISSEYLDYGTTYFDDDGEARIRTASENGEIVYYYRETPSSRWKELDGFVKQAGIKFSMRGNEVTDRRTELHSIGSGGRLLYISSRDSSDLFQVASFDPKEGVIKQVLAKHPKYDLSKSANGFSRLLFKKDTDDLIGLVYEADKPRVVWLDPHYAAVQKAIDTNIPDHVNLPLDWSKDGSTFVYSSFSDQDPGTIYVFKPLSGQLIPTFVMGERLKGKTLAKTMPFSFTARDGATLYGYVTRPPGESSTPTPLVVNVHGGPDARDCWRYDPTNQFLATRGYTVLQVNYRGSSGYGAAYQRAGLDTRIDTVIIDDIADGTKELIRQGGINPDQVAVMGSSFGGWATYLSLIRYPDLYKAGVAISAVSHWSKVLRDENSRKENDFGYAYWKNILYKRNFNEEERFIDPYLRASELKQPIYIMHGEYDTVVFSDEAKLMMEALQKTNETVQTKSYPRASHSYWRLEDRVSMLNEIEAFFRRNGVSGSTVK